jgi:prepilin signal peptidase PulO-like enzyme (type II secretory pathway)
LLILAIEKIWQKEALGGGDIKLIFVTGMYLGWEKNLWMLLIACMMGAVVGIVRAREKVPKEEAYFPFGPMIAQATVFCMLL